ncbi:hypothetical protein F1188_11750 [Roseospira marina]|uniref:Uncharacterized protein n=1 Tax=Roseospira marina TaxID=140057 RepID=A0A5M6IBA5_9PROT|nr:hypothetical protein [Roseospira marina]KAA5605237.1 hypothetical protein F1188_11750 [Roseospira marina]MBB4314696.1 hypothetical protein [Roseospira marina]MBB5087685.1 hypothetical protein [Roseospira marina]
MSQNHVPMTSGTAGWPSPNVGLATDVLLKAGLTGAIVGAAGAAAEAWPRVRSGEVSREAAVRDAAVTAGKTGVATGLGALAASALRGGPLVSAVVMVATGAAALHVMNKAKRPAAASRDATPAATTTDEGESA